MLFKIPVTDGHKKLQINAKFHKETFDFNFEQRFENIPFVSFFQYIYSVKNITSRNKSLFYKVTEKTKIQVSNKNQKMQYKLDKLFLHLLSYNSNIEN